MSKNLIERAEVKKLLDQMDQECWRQGHHEQAAFDLISIELITLIYEGVKQSGGDFCRISSSMFGKLTKSSAAKVDVRLRHLARYGLIRCESPWRNDGSGLRANLVTYPNPIIMALLGIDKMTRHKAPVIQHYVKMGLGRLDQETDVQGFRTDCAYGYPEPESQGGALEAGEGLIRMIAGADEEKARKDAENSLWRERDGSFVSGAANIWVFAQSQFGNGQSRPNWEGELTQLSPGARKERMELTKTFQRFGGRASALAWFVFVGGIADLDERGNPRFSLIDPHRQYVTIDKKPSQFAKHFNSILKDKIFIEIATKQWGSYNSELSRYFGEAILFPPRYETEYSLLGFEFQG